MSRSGLSNRDVMTSEDAIEIARRVAVAEGWPWFEPVSVRRKRRLLTRRPFWRVLSHADSRGMNVLVTIDDETGKVLSKHLWSR